MRQAVQHRFRVSFTASVRVRLTLWYLLVFAGIMLLYTSLSFFEFHSQEQLDVQLAQDAQHLIDSYKRAILSNQPLRKLQIEPADQEVVLLLSPDGSVLDLRGSLPESAIPQLQAKAEPGQVIFDMPFSQQHTNGWWNWHSTYHLVVMPILQQNVRMANLIVGLPQSTTSMLRIFFFHSLMALLIAASGGYWLAGKMLRPMKMITRTANEINATDLRRRLHLQRRDEFGELAATFDQMLARLEASFKRQAQFTSDASHELRTPLTIIDLEINRALTQAQMPEQYKQIVEQIQVENKHMTAIINSLLFLARADTGQMALHRQEVDLSDMALACVERLLPLARQKHISLATGDLPELLVSGDLHYLSQMLMNLLENAIKYTNGVGTRVYLELACEQKCWGVIRVQDDGPGISEEHLPYLFERFYRADRARTRQRSEAVSPCPEPGGSGLGLSIVQWIVQAHGGEVRVESKEGTGSLFIVRLPLLTAGQDNMTDS